MNSVDVKKICAGSVYKMIAIGLCCSFIPFFLLLGIFGAADMSALTWNRQPLTGFKAIFLSPIIGLLMALVFTAIIGGCTVLGLWLYSFFKPLTIEFQTIDNSEPTD
ncbi:MAG: hypothetical protein V7459_03510 [Oceanicoccus sp.]